MTLEHINQSNFDQVVEQAGGAVVVEFGAPWCKPCEGLEKNLLVLQNEWGQRVHIVHVNIDENNELAIRFSVMGLPTTVLFVNGQEKARLTGMQSINTLKARFEPHF